MKLIDSLTQYFFDTDPEEVRMSDKIWFFGFYAIVFVGVGALLAMVYGN